MTGDPWHQLGIAPTSDVAEIRRAYAAILKTIDVDRDPAAFRALREAFDEAKNWAPYVDLQDADDTQWVPSVSDEGDDATADDADAVIAGPLDPDLRDDEDEWDGEIIASSPFMVPDWDDDHPGLLPLAIRAATNELTDLLAGDAPVATIEPELLTNMRRIFDDPAMNEVAHAAAIEHDMAWTILAHMPRSKPMLAPAVTYFGWDTQAARWDCPHSIREVMGLYDASHYIDTLRRRDTSSATAISLLDSQSPPQKRNARLMKALLATIESEHPEALRLFAHRIVGEWQDLIADYDAMFLRNAYRDARQGLVALRSSTFGTILFLLLILALVVVAIFILLAMIASGAGSVILFGWAIVGLKNFIMRRWK